jgi:CheY-like chemotaxis protein
MSNPVTPVRAREPEQVGRILVVDDEEMVRKLACRILAEEGFAVHQAKDGLEALDLLGQHGDAVECVVSDIMMPRLNGVELMERISLQHPGLPVILMSGYGPEQLATYGITAPCAVLGKPFPAELLIAEVKRCLAPRGRS